MNKPDFTDLKGKVCIVTGGAGVLGSSIAEVLAAAGVKTVIADLNDKLAGQVATRIKNRTGMECLAVKTDVLSRDSLDQLRDRVNQKLGAIDLLINGAGGNSPGATTLIEQLPADPEELTGSFYDMDMDGIDQVFALNFSGTILATMALTGDMLKKKDGAVLNISSMSALKPLTKVVAYSAAKASVNNFTEWLAVHLGKTGIRVNAIAPGFFITEQNRFLVLDKNTGGFTRRGQEIVDHTPMERFGNPEDLHGAVLFLLSNHSKFITGVVLPVDGGYNAFGGV